MYNVTRELIVEFLKTITNTGVGCHVHIIGESEVYPIYNATCKHIVRFLEIIINIDARSHVYITEELGNIVG
jgi:hypothetical protein